MNKWAKCLFIFSTLLTLSPGSFCAVIVSTASSSYINVPATTNLDLANVGTLTAWFTPTFTSNSGTQAVLGGKGNFFNDNNGYGIYFFTTFGWVAEIANASSSNQASFNAGFNANVPVHLGMVWNGSTLKLYINGIQKASVSQTVNATPATLPFNIGAKGIAVPNVFISGTIEEVIVSSRAFSSQEILNLASSMEHYAYTDGLIGYWPLDDCNYGDTNVNVLDRSINKDNGVFKSAPTCVGSKFLSYP